MKILTILGARPQFIKAAAFSAALSVSIIDDYGKGDSGKEMIKLIMKYDK
jgi:UDP-N-acetylglucosamine 2-epimerase